MLEDLAGSGRGIFEVVSRKFSGGTEDSHNNNLRRTCDTTNIRIECLLVTRSFTDLPTCSVEEVNEMYS
jgi:hypothetical protein